MKAVVTDGEVSETGTFSVMDAGSCTNGPTSSQESITLVVDGTATPSTHWHTPIKISPCTPTTATQTPLKAPSATGKPGFTRRLQAKKFSVQDACLQENMKYRSKENETDMDIKQFDKECSLKEMQFFKAENELQKMKRGKVENEIGPQKLKREKVENEMEAALAVIKAANGARNHF